jgi:hypothetical protein
VSDLKPDRERRDLHKSNLPATSQKIGPILIKQVVASIATTIGSDTMLIFGGKFLELYSLVFV